MALGTNQFTATDLDVMIPEVWGEQINDFLRARLITASFFVDRSDELAGGGDTLHTPNLTEMTANTKSNGSEITLNSPTETKVDLTVDTWKEVSFLIEDVEAAQVKRSYALQERYAKNAAYTIAGELEDAIIALFDNFSNTVGASGTNLADSAIRQAIATLETNNVPVYDGDTAFFLHPNTFWRQVQNVDKFSLAQNSPVNDPSARRPDGHLYGIPVFVSPNLPNESGSDGRVNALAHRDAIHWARLSLPATGSSMVGSQGVRVQTNYVPEHLGFLTTADIVFGVVENRDASGVFIKSHATAE